VEKTANEMKKILFGYTAADLQVFYKKVFRNMVDFWRKTDMEKLRDMYA
jgi:hypothetical protein